MSLSTQARLAGSRSACLAESRSAGLAGSRSAGLAVSRSVRAGTQARIMIMMPLCLASVRLQCAAAVMVPGPVMVLRARSPGGQRAGMRLCRHEIVPSLARAAGVPAGPGPAFKYNRGKALGTAGSRSAGLAVSRSAGLALLEVSCAA